MPQFHPIPAAHQPALLRVAPVARQIHREKPALAATTSRGSCRICELQSGDFDLACILPAEASETRATNGKSESYIKTPANFV
jgi:hypothetical protein